MPLQMAYDAPTGDTYPNALVQIQALRFDFAERTVTMTLAYYRDAAAAADKVPVQVRDVGMTPAQFQTVFGGAGDPRPRLYTHLTSRPEFSGATVV
jgi:hypothetical protein